MRAKSTSPRKGRFGPGRNAILKAQLGRGRRASNLWSIYSARLNCDFILRSDTEVDHHCWLEGDEDVIAYVREPEPIIIYLDGEYCRTQFDARVELRGNRLRLDEVKESEDALDAREQRQREAQVRIAARAGFEYLRATRAFLECTSFDLI